MIDDWEPYTKRFRENDQPNTLNGAWFLPRFNYWTVQCYTPNWAEKRKGGKHWKRHKMYKFAYERGEDPEDYVHSIYNKWGIHLGDGVYVHDRTSQYFKFGNYKFVESQAEYEALEYEELH
jgi:hypothetical protein